MEWKELPKLDRGLGFKIDCWNCLCRRCKKSCEGCRWLPGHACGGRFVGRSWQRPHRVVDRCVDYEWI